MFYFVSLMLCITQATLLSLLSCILNFSSNYYCIQNFQIIFLKLVEFETNKCSPKEVLFLHRLVEAFKFAFAERMLLGDDRFINITEVGKFCYEYKLVPIHNSTSYTCSNSSPSQYIIALHVYSYRYVRVQSVLSKLIGNWFQKILKFLLQNVNRLLSFAYARSARSRIQDGNVLSNFRDYFLNGAPRAGTLDAGTAHFAIVAPDGSAASITSTINTLSALLLNTELGFYKF